MTMLRTVLSQSLLRPVVGYPLVFATALIFSKASTAESFDPNPRPPPHSHRMCTTSNGSPSSCLSSSMISISDAFDGGNIDFVSQETNGDGTFDVKLKVRPDPFTELEKKNHLQYFAFRSTITSPDISRVTFRILNAAECSYPNAWEGTTVFTTRQLRDENSWTRCTETKYEDGELQWTVSNPPIGSNYYAYFPPYTYDRHLQLIQDSVDAGAKLEVLGKSLDGREMECLQVGTGPLKAWLIHRQHPGETMAEYYAEGLLRRLLGLQTNGSVDGLTRQVLSAFTFYIVPNMCPDGSVRGHLRTNAGGANLNREWAPSPDYEAPTLERSPEVYGVLNKMNETGVDVFLDVHGDEALPANFLAGSEGCPNWGPRLQGLHGAFLAGYNRANSDMQIRIGYEPDGHLQGQMNICSNQISKRFDCLAVTLEMPFKDCISNPDPVRGWSPGRAQQLGASVLEALNYVQPYLRTTKEFWKELPEEDAYVRPSSNFG